MRAVYALNVAGRMNFIHDSGQSELPMNDMREFWQGVQELGEQYIDFLQSHRQLLIVVEKRVERLIMVELPESNRQV